MELSIPKPCDLILSLPLYKASSKVHAANLCHLLLGWGLIPKLDEIAVGSKYPCPVRTPWSLQKQDEIRVGAV